MGQPISVVRKPSPHPAELRFEINRTLTGMGHEHYASATAITGQRPPDELARRLFEAGGVRAVHIYSNMITVSLESGAAAPEAYEEVIRQLYIHYKPGVTVSFSAPAADAEPAPAPASA